MLFCSRNHCHSTIYLSCIQLHEFQKYCKKIFCHGTSQNIYHGTIQNILQNILLWKVTNILQWNVTKYLPGNVIKIIVMVSWSLNDH